jgi:hypothetical protein
MSHKKSRNKPQDTSLTPERTVAAQRHDNQNQHNANKRFWRDYEPIEKFNLLICIFTFVYALVTIGAYNIARSTLQIESSAFVFVSTVELTGLKMVEPSIPQVGIPLAVGIVLKNAGPTVARNVSMWTGACVKQGHLAANFSFPVHEVTDKLEMIGPNTEGPGTGLPLEEQAMKLLLTNPRYDLYVWGVVDYTDVFNKAHQTQFCYTYAGYEFTSTKSPKRAIFGVCGIHSCSDSDCPNKWGDNADETGCPETPPPN